MITEDAAMAGAAVLIVQLIWALTMVLLCGRLERIEEKLRRLDR